MAVVNICGVEYISFQELAKDSGMSPKSLQRAAGKAGLPNKKLGRSHFVQKVAFEKWWREEGSQKKDNNNDSCA
mgnify:CR=1 FL=1